MYMKSYDVNVVGSGPMDPFFTYMSVNVEAAACCNITLHVYAYSSLIITCIAF